MEDRIYILPANNPNIQDAIRMCIGDEDSVKYRLDGNKLMLRLSSDNINDYPFLGSQHKVTKAQGLEKTRGKKWQREIQ